MYVTCGEVIIAAGVSATVVANDGTTTAVVVDGIGADGVVGLGSAGTGNGSAIATAGSAAVAFIASDETGSVASATTILFLMLSGW